MGDDLWLKLWHFKIYITLILGVICTAWFLIGGVIDVTGLFRALANSRADDSDDGTVSYEDK